MAQRYYGMLTDKGLAKLRAAAQGTAPLALASMAFGDGGGQETAPSKAATALVNERYRAPVVEKYPHPTNPSILYVEGVIPSGIGGWTMREAGIYDTDGDLIVIAKPPAMDVALISEGAATEGIVRLPLVFESLDAVALLIDPTVVLATQGWVLDRLLSRPFLTVDSTTIKAPPAAPAAHALFVVPADATGAWVGQTHKLAYYHGAAWVFREAPVAKVVGASDTGKYYRRTESGWAEFTATATASGLVQFAAPAEVLAAAVADKVVSPATIAPAVQSGLWSYAAAGGTANALTAVLDPPMSAYSAGLMLRVRTGAAANTGPMTLDAGAGPAAIKRRDGAALGADDVPAASILELVYDGTAWRLMALVKSDVVGASSIVGRTIFYTSPGSHVFTTPPGVTSVEVEVWGAGGAGGASSDGSGSGLPAGTAGAGGGGGGYAYKRIFGLTEGDIIPVIVGAGGVGTAGTGGAGGSSSFGPHCTAHGGGGGYSGLNAYSSGGEGGGASGGDINLPGAKGGTGGLPEAFQPASLLHIFNKGGLPARTFGVVDAYGTGASGIGFGAGGSGASGGNGLPGGRGAGGIVIVRW